MYSIFLNKHYDLIQFMNDTYTVRAELNEASKLCIKIYGEGYVTLELHQVYRDIT